MKKAIVALGISALLGGCGTTGGAHHGSAHWRYAGQEGPEHWGELADAYGLCAKGEKQSPVNITGAHEMGLSAIEFHYVATTNPEVVNNGHTIQVNYAAGSYAVIEGKRYDLLQFHFHAPSEHAIEGDYADMVAHLVHKSPDDGQLAVVGILFDEGAFNAALAPVFENMPLSKGTIAINANINASDLLPADKSRYSYSGSLTTPPCSEGVNWNVMAASINVSADQVQAFKKIFAKSTRPIQPFNGRMIGLYSE